MEESGPAIFWTIPVVIGGGAAPLLGLPTPLCGPYPSTLLLLPANKAAEAVGRNTSS